MYLNRALFCFWFWFESFVFLTLSDYLDNWCQNEKKKKRKKTSVYSKWNYVITFILFSLIIQNYWLLKRFAASKNINFICLLLHMHTSTYSLFTNKFLKFNKPKLKIMKTSGIFLWFLFLFGMIMMFVVVVVVCSCRCI